MFNNINSNSPLENLYSNLQPYMNSLSLSMTLLEEYYQGDLTEERAAEIEKHLTSPFNNQTQNLIIDLLKKYLASNDALNTKKEFQRILSVNTATYEAFSPIIHRNNDKIFYIELNAKSAKSKSHVYTLTQSELENNFTPMENVFYITKYFEEQTSAKTQKSEWFFVEFDVRWCVNEKMNVKNFDKMRLSTHNRALPNPGRYSNSKMLVDMISFICEISDPKKVFLENLKEVIYKKNDELLETAKKIGALSFHEERTNLILLTLLKSLMFFQVSTSIDSLFRDENEVSELKTAVQKSIDVFSEILHDAHQTPELMTKENKPLENENTFATGKTINFFNPKDYSKFEESPFQRVNH